MISFPTPITIRSPPVRTTCAAVTTLDSTPVHSRIVAGASYSVGPNIALISAALDSALKVVFTWYTWHDGTNFFANARRFGSRSVITRGCAPDARAAARAIRPMGPAPQIIAPRPMESFTRDKPCSTTERGSRSAPWAYDTFSGNLCIY
jgi:hypothetical protein